MLLTTSARRRSTAVTPVDFSFPLQFGPPRLVVPLGEPGEWDATDINNPNVAYDAATSRWLLQYTGHLHTSTGNANYDEQQKYGYSWADTLNGPWVKDAANPAFAETPPTLYSMNGGLVRLQDGTWLHSYTTRGDTTKFATSPDLYTWTILGVEFPRSWDSFLRLKPDGRVECFYVIGTDRQDPYGRNSKLRVCKRAVSTNGGNSWTHDAGAFVRAPEWVYDGYGWGEFAVWHYPGYEDQRILFLADANLTSDDMVRVNVMGRTLDGGATWDWAVVNEPTGSASDWNGVSVFDSFLTVDGNKAYLFFAGSDTRTNLLDGNIQIGVRVATLA